MSQNAGAIPAPSANNTTLAVLVALSFCHMLNDMMQALLAGIYPLLSVNYNLSFWQIGLLTFAFQVTASILQPLVGLYTDKNPKPYSLVVGMGFTFTGLLTLAFAHHYAMLVLAAAMIGIGSSIFHPDSSRIARLASGGRFGFAQSLFQVGGNFGSALGPLMAALIVVTHGQESVSWFSGAALLGMIILWQVGGWYSRNRVARTSQTGGPMLALPRRRVLVLLAILCTLVFSKHVYMASFSSYYTFYLIETFGLSIREAQILLFVFFGSVATGTLAGGVLGDRFGRRNVIWFSILGVLPLTLALPYAGLWGTVALSIAIGLVLSSAFPAIVVYAQELVPGKVGMIAGLFFGLAFGIGGIGAAILGVVADARGIDFVYHICSFLPAIGLLAVLLPRISPRTA